MAVYQIMIVLFTNCVLKVYASYHWIVTETGKIQSQIENSAFPLRRPYDLLSLLEQEQRIAAVNELYEKLLFYKKSIDSQWSKIEGEGDLEKRLYSTDVDCVRGVMPLTQHDLNTDFVDYGQGSRPKMKSDVKMQEPDCTTYSDLDFSMMTFPHLHTLNRRDNITMTVKPVPLKSHFDFDIDAMLKSNNSDWTAYNVAAAYWRVLSNGSNAIECARRAVYFSPRSERHIALLNLGTLLQQIQSLGEAAIVLHSAVDHDPVQHLSHLALGNVYAVLGDYTRSLACYENVLSLRPGHPQALQIKHALLCHKKLESGLLEIHGSLQSILHDLQNYHEIQERWLHLQNQIRWERDNKYKDFFSMSHPVSLNLRMLLQNVEVQAKTLNEEVSKRVSRKGNYISVPPKIERNQFKTESVFDCNVEKCPVYVHQVTQDDLILEQQVENDKNEESGVNALEYSDYSLQNKMNTVINFIKSLSYDTELNLLDFKQKMNQQISLLKEMNIDDHFSVDQSSFLNSFDACVNDNTNIKKLNECFMRIFNQYSVDVSNRISKLKERMKLISQSPHSQLPGDETKKNNFADESSLENYIEASSDFVLENLKESGSCQRFRDTTEL